MQPLSRLGRRLVVPVAVVLLVAQPVLATVATDWHRIELPASGPSHVNAVTWGADTFVAVGREGDPARPAVWLSPDGAGWDQVTDITAESEASIMRDVAVASPGFLAVGSVGDDAAMWSAFPEADGWRRVLVAGFLGAEMHAIESTWAGPVAVGFDTDTQSAGIWTYDGNVWSQIPSSPDLEGVRLFGIETGSFDLLAVGEDVRDGSGAALVSQDGLTWRRLEAAEASDARFRDAHWGGEGFTVVGVASNGGAPPTPTVYIAATNGDPWAARSVTDERSSELFAVDFSGTGGIAVGHAAESGEGVIVESDADPRWSPVDDAGDGFANSGIVDVERGGDVLDVLVAGGWTGGGAGDGPDARATIWTTAAPRTRAFVDTVASPLDISLDPVVIATGAAVAAGVTLLIPFPGALFNTTLEANYAEIGSWFDRPRRWLGAGLRRLTRRMAGGDTDGHFWQRPLGIATFLVISAVLYALLDPTLGFDLHSAALVVGLLLGLVATTAAFALPTMVFHRLRVGELGRFRVLPGTILIAVACVFLSRVTGFQPGYMYGLLIGLAFARELSVGDEGRATAIATGWMLAVSVAAWVGLIPVREAVGADPDALGPSIAQAALSTVVVAGLEGVVFGLLPVRFMPGAALYAFSRRTWAILFGIGVFGLLHVLVNPTSGYLADASRTPLLTIVVLFVGFALASVGLWAYFRFRPPRTPAVASA